MAKIKYENAECCQIPRTDVYDFWWKLAPLVEKFVEAAKGEFSAHDIKEFAISGLMQLFVIHTEMDTKLVIITEFVQYPRKKILRVVGIGGEAAILCRKFFSFFEMWARENGAVAIETFSSESTIILNKRLGMRPVYTLMRKEI